MDTAALIGSSWIFALAFLAVLGDVFLPLIPSGTVVIAAVLQTAELRGAPLLLAVGVAVASFAGDLLVLRLARDGNPWFARRLERRPQLAVATRAVLRALETRAAWTVIVARFVPAGRTVLDLAMGGAEDPRRYLRWSAVAAALWAVYIVSLGWLNSHWFDTVWLSFAVSCAAATAVSAGIARLVRRHRLASAEAVAGS